MARTTEEILNSITAFVTKVTNFEASNMPSLQELISAAEEAEQLTMEAVDKKLHTAGIEMLVLASKINRLISLMDRK